MKKEMKNKREWAKLKDLMDTMRQIPEERKKEMNEQNLMWFLRNGVMSNIHHPDIDEATRLTKNLLNNNFSA